MAPRRRGGWGKEKRPRSHIWYGAVASWLTSRDDVASDLESRGGATEEAKGESDIREANRAVGEGEVLVATIRYLLTRNAKPIRVSVARGRGIDAKSITQDVKDCLRNASHELPEFEPSGPDIIAATRKECWIVECKGASAGKPQTQRNNFDRALASVVSYYGDRSLLEFVEKRKGVLALALPATTHYRKLLKGRVHARLRRQLNLWVLLYEPAVREMTTIPPNRSFPT